MTALPCYSWGEECGWRAIGRDRWQLRKQGLQTLPLTDGTTTVDPTVDVAKALLGRVVGGGPGAFGQQNGGFDMQARLD